MRDRKHQAKGKNSALVNVLSNSTAYKDGDIMSKGALSPNRGHFNT